MRLPPVPGEWIDRSQTIPFVFEGQTVHGHPGDCISSALLASGASVLGRSFKYHRPRGVLSLANHDVNAMVQWSGRPNVRADVTPLAEGMRLNAVNTFGGLQSDRARMLGSIARFLPVGFYYKAFHTKRLFPMWERLFRVLTGLGKVDFSMPHLHTAKRYGFCDVLVIGGGPSGLAAALAAADQGAEVLLVDENAELGGSGGYARGADADTAGTHLDILATVRGHPGIRVMTGTCAAGYYSDHWIPLVDRRDSHQDSGQERRCCQWRI